MGLLGNNNIILRQVGKRANYCGIVNGCYYMNSGGRMGVWFRSGSSTDSDVQEWKKAAQPNGYESPYVYVLPLTSGGLGSINMISGSSSFSMGLAMGAGIEASMNGSGSLASTLSLITSLVTTITSISSLSGSLTGSVGLEAAMTGSSTLTSDLSLIANIVAELQGSGVLTSDLKGKLSMSADIYVNQSEATVQQLVEGVWNALATEYNNSGTMGERLNDAGSSGDPWSTPLDASYASGTAGSIVRNELLKLADYLGLK